ncbi:hypothetical protein MTO96_025408 [Rhipicephalus appendiculatus]
MVIVDQPADEPAPEPQHLPEHDPDFAKTPIMTLSEPQRPGTSIVPYGSPQLRNSTSATYKKALVYAINHGKLRTPDAYSPPTTEQIGRSGLDGSTAHYEQDSDTVQVDETYRPARSSTVQAEVSLKGPRPIVVAGERPLQSYDRKIAVVTDRRPVQVEKHVENVEAHPIEAALESARQVKHTAGIGSESVENKF